MKTTTIASACALAAFVTAGACTFSTTPEGATDDDAGARPATERGDRGDRGDRGKVDDAGAETGASVAPPVNDDETLATFTPAEVASIAEAIHLGEIKQGELAVQLAQSPEVKAYAQHMVDDHTKGQKRIQTLLGPNATTEAVEPRLQRDATAAILIEQGGVLTNSLKAKTGAPFDLAYMTAEIAEHAKALALIDRSLLPSAAAPQLAASRSGSQGATSGSTQTTELNAADLQKELGGVRTEVIAHLLDALRIQKALRVPTGATPPPTGTATGATPPPAATPPPRS